jgi:hypothetical protein
MTRAHIIQPTGTLDPLKGEATFVLGVSSAFDQDVPNAMMTCRMGYCHGFEEIGVPYLITDLRELPSVINDLPDPVCMLLATDVHLLDMKAIRQLQRVRCIVWATPWFRDSDRFFARHDLDPEPWHIPDSAKRKILELEPDFCFTATAANGLHFFENWMNQGVPVHSLPLACDTRYYSPDTPNYPDFADVKLSFVGGYWESKGRQIDAYLRQFEDILTIYGYNKWPYTGYRGALSRDMEASLYRQAKVSPTINEPTVALLKGQINERVFKVMGSSGCTVVDAVPEYRDLYSADELFIAETPDHFRDLVLTLLSDSDLRASYRKRGFEATLARHTYRHRAISVLEYLGLRVPNERGAK